MVDSASICMERDDLAATISWLKRAVDKEPDNKQNVYLYIMMGTVQKQLGQLAEAAESLTLALDYEPNAIPVLLSRAAVYVEVGNNERAYVDYCRVLDQDADNKEARSLRAYVAVRSRMWDVARGDYEHLLTLDASDATARQGLALLNQKQGRLEEATEQLSGLVHDYPAEPSYLLARAEVLAQRELYELALLDLEKAISLDAADPYAYVSRAEVWLAMKHHRRQARKDLDTAVSLGMSRTALVEMYERCK